nr:YegS/Rv2252/BmrU family lipid kinase [uncultured Caproiciproducens sp.]
MRYVFIVNPTAGKKNAYYTVFPAIREYFDANGMEFSCHITEKPNHATQLVKIESLKGDPVRIYALGGDGTLSETAAGAIGRKNVEIGIFPCGSGNDYIKTFGESSCFLSLKKQLDAKSRPVDMIHSDGRYSINLCSVGLDARVAYEMVKFKKVPLISGSMAYNFAILKVLAGKIGEHLEILIDGVKKYDDIYLFALAGSGKYYGGGYCGAPLAIPDDGLLDFVLVKKPPMYKIPSLITVYKNGGHLESKKFESLLTFCRGKRMEIKAPEHAIANFDGECSIIDKLYYEVVPAAVNFIVPV